MIKNKKIKKLFKNPKLFAIDALDKKTNKSKLAKKTKKILENPTLYFIDYLNKHPKLKKTLEEHSNTIPLAKYHYKLYTHYKKMDFKVKAEDALRSAIQLKKEPIYFYELGMRLKQKKQWWQAVDAFENAIELSDNVPSSWYKEYALVLTEMNRHNEASLAWEKALDDKNKNADNWFRYGYALELSNKLTQSEEKYTQTVALDKDKNSKELGIGIFHEKKGWWISASEAYKESLKQNPMNANIAYRLALSLDRCYEWEKAEEVYLHAISLKPENIDWYYRLGFVRERQEKYEESAQAYMHAAHNRKAHTPYWYYRLGYVLEKAGFYQESNEAFLMMKKITIPKSKNITVPFINKDKYFYDMAIELKQKKQWWQAVDAFENAIELSDNVPLPWHKEYALVLTEMNRYDDASLAWEKALDNKSKNADDWFRYGYAL
jgi:CDP-glycerol glycerophosphotransferase